MKKVLTIFGTRPEAIKMAPVLKALAAEGKVCSRLVVTAQHRALLDQVLTIFGLTPDHDLNIMADAQSLTDIGVRCLRGLEPILADEKPDLVLVHGDTSTSLYASLAAYNQKIPVGHVEAGLRTGDRYSPFPEEINRRLTDQLATLHLAPTGAARDNLLRDGIAPGGIFVTGNTAIDAILIVSGGPAPERDTPPVVLVECHRRENFGEPHAGIFRALARLAAQREVDVVVSSHPNPAVRSVLERELSGKAGVSIIEPPAYPDWAALMRRATLILTDSGGLQEEGPSLNVPVVLARSTTERPEGVAAGCVVRVDPAEEPVFQAVHGLLTDGAWYQKSALAPNPFGDGRAAERIAAGIYWFLGLTPQKPPEFSGANGACQCRGLSV